MTTPNGFPGLADDDPLAATVLEATRSGGARVLSLGGGPGPAARHLVRAADKEVTLVDPDDARLEAAAEEGIGRVIRADVGGLTWVERVTPEQFDVILVHDVLEDVEHVLRAIREHDLLADGGHLVLTVTDEDPEGLLDASEHAPSTAPNTRRWPSTELRHRLEAQGFTATRILRPPPDGARGALVVCAGLLESKRLDALHAEVDRLRAQLDQCEQRRERIRTKRDDERRRADELQARLEAAYASRTWRVGRLIVSAPGAVKRGLRSRR